MTEWFKARNVWSGAFESLSDAEAGRLAKALWKYAATGEQANLSGAEKACYAMFILTLQMDEVRDSEISDARKEAGEAGARSRWGQKPGMAKMANAMQDETEMAKMANANSKNQNKTKKQNQTQNQSLNTDADRAREVETPLGPITVDPLIVKVQRELLGLTDTHYQELNDFRGMLGDEVIGYAIDTAVSNGSRTWAYVRAILRTYLKDGIKTVAEAKARDERRSELKAQGGKPAKLVSAQQYTQRSYAESDFAGNELLAMAALENDD